MPPAPQRLLSPTAGLQHSRRAVQHHSLLNCSLCTGPEAVLDPGVYTLDNLRTYGRKKGWCPYYLARHMLAYANVIVYNYQYMLDPKVLPCRRRCLVPLHTAVLC